MTGEGGESCARPVESATIEPASSGGEAGVRTDGVHVLRWVRVLPLRAGDWRTLRGLSLEIVHEEPEVFREDRDAVLPGTADGWRTLAQGLTHPANDYLCGWLGQKLVAAVYVSQPEGDVGVIGGMWASRPVRGAGVARALLSWSLAMLRQLGVREARVWVFEENHPARRLYRRAGFVDVLQTSVDPRTDSRVIEMRRRLP